MGYKVEDFTTTYSVNDCEVRFRSGISSGRGTSARIGGVTARLMGGEALSWASKADVAGFLRENPEIADMHDDPPTAAVGVGVPKAYGAHQNGTSVLALIWNRGANRQVRLIGFHSLTGGSHATKLLAAARAAMSA